MSEVISELSVATTDVKSKTLFRAERITEHESERISAGIARVCVMFHVSLHVLTSKHSRRVARLQGMHRTANGHSTMVHQK